MKIFALSIIICIVSARASSFAPKPEEQQLPKKMHSAMKELPRVRVGQTEGDIVGRDNRALQAAVDYVAGLGGGNVEVGPGEYLMRDSLHVRWFVTVRGVPGKTIFAKRTGPSPPWRLMAITGKSRSPLWMPQDFRSVTESQFGIQMPAVFIRQ